MVERNAMDPEQLWGSVVTFPAAMKVHSRQRWKLLCVWNLPRGSESIGLKMYIFYHFLSSAFPLRFHPSHGIMEIYKIGSWQKLCTRSWDTDEETLTCKAVGYSTNTSYGNSTLYTESNNASDRIHYNCTTLTECGSDIDGKTQLCTGNFCMT